MFITHILYTLLPIHIGGNITGKVEVARGSREIEEWFVRTGGIDENRENNVYDEVSREHHGKADE